MESKKFKLLQDFGVLKKGDIISRRWTMYSGNCIDTDYYCRVINNSYDYGFELHEKLVQNSPDWFAPMLFTTEDKVDIYLGDEIWVVDNRDFISSWFATENCKNVFSSDKIFSIQKAATKYLLLKKAKLNYPIGTKIKDYAYSNIIHEIKSDVIIEREGTIFIDEVIVYHKKNWLEKYIEPNYPKSWEELESVEGYYLSKYSGKLHFCPSNSLGTYKKAVFNTSKQTESALAFAQLSQLVAEMNGDWIADFTDKSDKFVIKRHNNELFTGECYGIFHPLAFKSAEARDFSFEHHKELWNKYNQL